MRKCQIIIPTYFGNQLAANCVSSLLKEIPDADIRILKNDIGWLKAANILFKDALDLGVDVLLLNDDTFALSNLVKEAQDFAYSRDGVGIVGGKALAPNQETVINYGIYVAPDGNTAHEYYGKKRNEVTEPKKSRAVEGSCFFIKYDCLLALGGFDEGYGMGFREEVDFCFAARELGFEVWSVPTMEYVHFVSQTHGKLGITNSTYDYFMSKWRNKLKLGEI